MARAAGSVRLTGIQEVNRAFRRLETGADGELKDKLLDLAGPVAEDARGRISRYRGARTTTIKPRARIKGAYVTQGARKKTGRRGDFGSLQMRHLLGALFDHQSQIEEGVDDLLNYLSRKEGF